jgi:peptidoglycan/LPS O-acetylase OafA/YrhL
MSLEPYPRWTHSLGPSRLPRSLGKASSAHLDLIRAVAAWLVMWGHLRELFFVDFGYAQHGGGLVKLIYFFTGFGHQAVVVFFVLSGFLIGSTILKRFASGSWSWRGYAIDRLTRLYVVLIPGLLFGLLWDKTGAALFASTGLYSHPLEGFGAGIAQSRLTVGIFLANLAFLQTLVSPVFGSNGPLWSLANEFWYYALFPAGLSAVVAWSTKRLRRAIPLTILTISMAAFLRSPILPGFLIWMAGCALVVVYSRLTLRSRIWLVTYLLISATGVLACLVTARTRGSGLLASDFALGIMFSSFLFGILQIELGQREGAYPKTAHLFADFSYSLYVLHFPLLLFFRAGLVSSRRWQPDTPHLFYGLTIGVATLLFAWIVSIFTEKKTSGVRRWVYSVIPRSADAGLGTRSPYTADQGGGLREGIATAQTDSV